MGNSASKTAASAAASTGPSDARYQQLQQEARELAQYAHRQEQRASRAEHQLKSNTEFYQTGVVVGGVVGGCVLGIGGVMLSRRTSSANTMVRRLQERVQMLQLEHGREMARQHALRTRDVEQARKAAVTAFARDILPVNDHLTRCILSCERELQHSGGTGAVTRVVSATASRAAAAGAAPAQRMALTAQRTSEEGFLGGVKGRQDLSLGRPQFGPERQHRPGSPLAKTTSYRIARIAPIAVGHSRLRYTSNFDRSRQARLANGLGESPNAASGLASEPVRVSVRQSIAAGNELVASPTSLQAVPSHASDLTIFLPGFAPVFCNRNSSRTGAAHRPSPLPDPPEAQIPIAARNLADAIWRSIANGARKNLDVGTAGGSVTVTGVRILHTDTEGSSVVGQSLEPKVDASDSLAILSQGQSVPNPMRGQSVDVTRGDWVNASARRQDQPETIHGERSEAANAVKNQPHSFDLLAAYPAFRHRIEKIRDAIRSPMRADPKRDASPFSLQESPLFAEKRISDGHENSWGRKDSLRSPGDWDPHRKQERSLVAGLNVVNEADLQESGGRQEQASRHREMQRRRAEKEPQMRSYGGPNSSLGFVEGFDYMSANPREDILSGTNLDTPRFNTPFFRNQKRYRALAEANSPTQTPAQTPGISTERDRPDPTKSLHDLIEEEARLQAQFAFADWGQGRERAPEFQQHLFFGPFERNRSVFLGGGRFDHDVGGPVAFGPAPRDPVDGSFSTTSTAHLVMPATSAPAGATSPGASASASASASTEATYAFRIPHVARVEAPQFTLAAALQDSATQLAVEAAEALRTGNHLRNIKLRLVEGGTGVSGTSDFGLSSSARGQQAMRHWRDGILPRFGAGPATGAPGAALFGTPPKMSLGNGPGSRSFSTSRQTAEKVISRGATTDTDGRSRALEAHLTRLQGAQEGLQAIMAKHGVRKMQIRLDADNAHWNSTEFSSSGGDHEAVFQMPNVLRGKIGVVLEEGYHITLPGSGKQEVLRPARVGVGSKEYS